MEQLKLVEAIRKANGHLKGAHEELDRTFVLPRHAKTAKQRIADAIKALK